MKDIKQISVKLMLLLTLLFCYGCNRNDFNFKSYDEVQKENFEVAFVNTFGQYASEHDWGFTAQYVPTGAMAPTAMTRGHNVNRNQWSDNFIVPPNVTTNEHDLVLTEFSKQRIGAVNNVNIAWTDFFVYQVHKGTTHYTDGTGADLIGSDKMNHLQCYKSYPMSDGEHINDFNNGAHTSSWGDIIGATLMVNSGTADFAYHNSIDSKYHNEYIILAGADIHPSLAGFYYIGFDFYATHQEGQESNKNMDVERDWIFNDWIIRVSPAQFKNMQRIIAEDLGTAVSDFDYNDVVFDVALSNDWIPSMNANKLVAHIILQAAGGTLPLFIGDKEVHELFNVSTNTMVNTGAGTSRPAVAFTYILGDADWSKPHTANEIPVVVKNKNNIVELTTSPGMAPEKICVPITTRWMKEYINIINGYHEFGLYVINRGSFWNTYNVDNLY